MSKCVNMNEFTTYMDGLSTFNRVVCKSCIKRAKKAEMM